MKLAIAVAPLFLVTACATSATNSLTNPRVVRPASDAQKSVLIERVKSLAGTWEGKAPEGPQTITFAVCSGGSAVREVMFPGTPHEMTNMYTMDGDTLLMTHYCAMGNQPRLTAEGDCATGPIHFNFVDGTNIARRDDAHMDSLIMTPGADGQSLVNDWSSWQDGKVTGHKVMNLQRKRSW